MERKPPVATPPTAERRSLKFKLTHRQVLELSVDRWPVESASGKVTIAARPSSEAGKAYRVLDGNQGAPTGFGFRVGSTMTTYEVVKRGPSGVHRFSLGNVADQGLEEAYAEARKKLHIVKATGDSPQAFEATRRAQESIKHVTVEECLERYVEYLTRQGRKASSVQSARDSLARLSRPEVGIANKQVRDLRDDHIEAAFHALRKSAMVRSNRIPTSIKQKLKGHDDWGSLTTEQLEGMGITGRFVQRVKSAGLAATEHSFSDARRAVALVVKDEQKRASIENRVPVLTYNPFDVIWDNALMRDANALRRHYDRAQVRNPLGDDTLPRVLKAILARRDEQGGQNATATDYLLLTLLWGTRRGEAAELRWFDRCSRGQIQQEEVSWVWLGGEDEINPRTRRKGPQVYFADTKNGEQRFLPVTYFARRILQRRFDERLDDALAKREAAAATSLLEQGRASRAAAPVLKALEKGVADAQHALDRTRFVFPSRSSRSKAGHYSDSKSILANVRRDAGLADIREEVDQGLTPHDLRRTLGRYAALLYGETRVVSHMLNHRVKGHGSDMAASSEIYTVQEWDRLREAFATVEEAMIRSSPRVYNRLKGANKEPLSEVGDAPVTIFANRNRKTALDGD